MRTMSSKVVRVDQLDAETKATGRSRRRFVADVLKGATVATALAGTVALADPNPFIIIDPSTD